MKMELKGQSNNSDEPKTSGEGSLEGQLVLNSSALKDVFEGSLKPPEFVEILINCMKNVENEGNDEGK